MSPEETEYKHAIRAKSRELFEALGYIEPAARWERSSPCQEVEPWAA